MSIMSLKKLKKIDRVKTSQGNITLLITFMIRVMSSEKVARHALSTTVRVSLDT